MINTKKFNHSKLILAIITISLICILLPTILAQNILSETNLQKGKNNITTSENFKPIYVKDFIRKYPEIEVISYLDGNETVGYINLFNGIGENFLIQGYSGYGKTFISELFLEYMQGKNWKRKSISYIPHGGWINYRNKYK